MRGVILYYVYILKSLKNGSYYIGSTKNLPNRIEEHNAGETKYTRHLLPFELVYTETYQTLQEARQRELYIKSKKSRKYIERLINGGCSSVGSRAHGCGP